MKRGGNVSSYYFYNRDHRPPTRLTAGKNRSDRVLCSVSRASAGLTTEYLIVSSKPPTGYYVDGVTACPVSRASAGLTEYLIVSNLECKGESELLRSDCLPPPHLGDTFGHPRTPNDHP